MIQIPRQISADDIGVPLAKVPVYFSDCVHRPAFGTITVSRVLQVGLEDRLQHDLGGGLHHPVANGWNAERTLAIATGFGDHHTPHRIGPVRLRNQFLAQARQPSFQAFLLDLRKGYPVHACCARIGAGKPVSVQQNVLPADFVVEHIEAKSGFRLRFAIELSLKAPDFIRRFKAHRQSPSPHLLQKRTKKSGSFAPPALPGFIALMTLSDSRQDRCLMQR